MPVKYALVGLGSLVAHYFDSVEEFAQAGLGELALLIEQIALGDEDKPMG